MQDYTEEMIEKAEAYDYLVQQMEWAVERFCVEQGVDLSEQQVAMALREAADNMERRLNREFQEAMNEPGAEQW